jgi:hypothetical protein
MQRTSFAKDPCCMGTSFYGCRFLSTDIVSNIERAYSISCSVSLTPFNVQVEHQAYVLIGRLRSAYKIRMQSSETASETKHDQTI